jgi:hypothetical protein
LVKHSEIIIDKIFQICYTYDDFLAEIPGGTRKEPEISIEANQAWERRWGEKASISP